MVQLAKLGHTRYLRGEKNRLVSSGVNQPDEVVCCTPYGFLQDWSSMNGEKSRSHSLA
jgi:hypothetical protein